MVIRGWNDLAWVTCLAQGVIGRSRVAYLCAVESNDDIWIPHGNDAPSPPAAWMAVDYSNNTSVVYLTGRRDLIESGLATASGDGF